MDRWTRPGLLAIALWAAGPTAARAQPADTLQARSLAATCASCHGTNGQARGDIKPLAGVSADTIIAALAAFKSGERPATVMHQIARGYSDEQVQLIARYMAAQAAVAR